MSNSRKSLEEFRSKFLKVHNFHSNFSQYYHIDTPFSVVLEVYRSDLENKYFKIANFSPNDFSEILIDDESLLSSMAKRLFTNMIFLNSCLSNKVRSFLK